MHSRPVAFGGGSDDQDPLLHGRETLSQPRSLSLQIIKIGRKLKHRNRCAIWKTNDANGTFL